MYLSPNGSADIVWQTFRVNFDLFPFNHFHRRLSKDALNFLLQIPDATFATVLIDQVRKGLVVNCNLLVQNARFFVLLWDEIALGDFDFFLGHIARDFNHFHAIT